MKFENNYITKREIKDVLERLYLLPLEKMKFKSEEEYEEVYSDLDDMFEEVLDVIDEKIYQINSKLPDLLAPEVNREMESYIYNCQL